MAKYIKLGEKAEIFFDPTTRTKVLKGQIIKLEDKQKFSKKIAAAIGGGHLVYSTKEAYNDYMEDSSQATTKSATKEEAVDWMEPWLEANEVAEKTLKPLRHEKLVELAKHFESEFTAEELKDSTKAELIEEILDLQPEEEDEDEE